MEMYRKHACRHALPVFAAALFLCPAWNARPQTASHASDHIKAAFRSECEELIEQTIEEAKQEILAAVFSFSSRDIAGALIEAAARGVDVHIKIDRDQAREDYCSSQIQRLRRAGISVRTIGMPGKYDSMHNKFMVVDRNTVVTGSCNFTVSAAIANWENAVAVTSPSLAEAFADEWQKIRSRK